MITNWLQPIELRSTRLASAFGEAIIERCRNDGLVWVRAPADVGTEPPFWDDLLRDLGERAPVEEDATTGVAIGDIWTTVAFDPSDPQTFRHSCTAQPLHTDGAYVPRPPEVVFLVCRRAARKGGATKFLDGRNLVRLLAAQHPHLLQALKHQTVRFAKGGRCVESAIISSHRAGLRLCWNFYALAEEQEHAAWELANGFRTFLEKRETQRAVHSIRLAPGEAVFFRDDQLLHGRDAFSHDHPHGRFLWKGGLRL